MKGKNMDLIDIIFRALLIVFSLFVIVVTASYLIFKLRKPEPIRKGKDLVPYIVPKKRHIVIQKSNKKFDIKTETYDVLPGVSKKSDKFKRVHNSEGIAIKLEKLKTGEMLKYYDDEK
jgi:hypothetical protein